MYNQYGERQDSVLLDAVLAESGLPTSTTVVIKKIVQSQQEVIDYLNRQAEGDKWRYACIEKRLDELLAKVDPEEAEKRKKSEGLCEAQSSRGIPSLKI